MVRRLCGLVVLLVWVVVVLGCSNQAFDRPLTSWVSDRWDSGEPYLDPGKSPDEIRQERLSEIISARQKMPKRRSRDYLLGPGDLLEVNVFALVSPDKTQPLACRVSGEGYIVLPLVGRIRASGLSVPQLTEAIQAAYAGRYLKEPQVTVDITEFHSVAINVTGAVGKPGVFYLKENSSTVLAALALAEGVQRDAADELLVIRAGHPGPQARGREDGSGDRGPQILRIDLEQLVDEGNPLFNIELFAGDTVSVPRHIKENRVVYVLGYVNRPSAVPVLHGRIDAFDAVARAGGLRTPGRAENSYVVREIGEGEEPLIVPVDLTKIARGIRPHLYLQPGDTLVVGSSIYARLAEFIRPTASAAASISATP